MNELLYSFYQFENDNMPLSIYMAGITYEDKSYNIARQNFNALSFEYIVSGEGTLEINGNIFYPKKNDVYILTKNSTHRYYSNPANPWVKSFIVFGGTFAEAIFKAYIPSELYFVENLNISVLLNEIVIIASEDSDYREKNDRISTVILKIAQTINNYLTNKPLSIAEHVEQWITSNIDNRIVLSDICKEINYSKNQLINLFKTHYGMTPYTYYKNKRIENAKRYLIETNLSIQEIADRMNFADRHYFSNFFKENVGFYPAKYRKITNYNSKY